MNKQPETSNQKQETLTAAPPLGWAVLLLYLTLAPADRLPPQPRWELLSFDTFAHAAFFAVQAALTWLWLRRQPRWPLLRRHARAAVLLGGTAFGAAIEVLQMVLPFNRHGEWSDLLSDCLGIALALGLCALAAPALRRRGWLPGPPLALPLLPPPKLLPPTLLLLATCLGVAPAPAQAQDLARARATIAALAAPRLHGRGYVQQGERLAAAYLRWRLGALGLRPLARNFTQSFPFDVNTFPGQLRLAVAPAPGGGLARELVPGTDFIAGPASASAAFGGAVLALDTLVFQDTVAARRYLLPAPGAKTPPCPNCLLLLRERDRARLKNLPAATQARLEQRPQVLLVDKLTASLASTQAPAMRLEVRASAWPTATRTATVAVDAWHSQNYSTQNLCALLPGRTQPDSFLVVSAHYDHLGRMGARTYFPGANDNASGVALLLELAAHYARPENRPAYSLVFLLFGAEEAGLVGSRYFVAHPLVPLPRIKFLLNLDMLGTGETGATVVNGKLLPAAFARLAALNERRRYLPALGARGPAANSDHFPFSEAGVPAFFIYTRGGSPAYHDVHDRPEALSLAGFAGAFGLLRDFLDGFPAASPQRGMKNEERKK